MPPIYTPPQYPPQRRKTETGTSYTIVAADLYTLVTLDNGAAITLNVPADATLTFPVNGFVDFIQFGAGQVTITPAGGVTINGTPGLLFVDQFSAVSLVKVAANEWNAIGRLST